METLNFWKTFGNIKSHYLQLMGCEERCTKPPVQSEVRVMRRLELPLILLYVPVCVINQEIQLIKEHVSIESCYWKSLLISGLVIEHQMMLVVLLCWSKLQFVSNKTVNQIKVFSFSALFIDLQMKNSTFLQ